MVMIAANDNGNSNITNYSPKLIKPKHQVDIDQYQLSAINLYHDFEGIKIDDWFNRADNFLNIGFRNMLSKIGYCETLRDSLDATLAWELDKEDELGVVGSIPVKVLDEFFNIKALKPYNESYKPEEILEFLINWQINDFANHLMGRLTICDDYTPFDYAIGRLKNEKRFELVDILKRVKDVDKKEYITFLPAQNYDTFKIGINKFIG